MTARQRVAGVVLWIVLVLMGTMFGASVYQRISIIPEWGGNLPQSAILYFRGTNTARAMGHFWAGTMGPTAVAVVLALVLNWPTLFRRRWIGRGAILFFAMLAWTAIYFIPKGVAPLMERGCEGLSPEAITQMGRSWIFWDWFRMAGTLGAYLCFLKAATVPCAGSTSAPSHPSQPQALDHFFFSLLKTSMLPSLPKEPAYSHPSAPSSLKVAGPRSSPASVFSRSKSSSVMSLYSYWVS